MVFLLSFLLLCYTLLTFDPATYPFSRSTVQIMILVSFVFSVYSHLLNKNKQRESKDRSRASDLYKQMCLEKIREAEMIDFKKRKGFENAKPALPIR